MKIQTSVRVKMDTLRTLSCVILVGFLTATSGFEEDCGLDNAEPCKVSSYADLTNIEENGLGKKYVLMNDIQAPTDPPDNFTPIGGKTKEVFVGTLDGNGHAILDIYIEGEYAPLHDWALTSDAGHLDPVGLFADLGANATISNLIIKDATVIASGFAGALAGSIKSRKARVENVVVDNPHVTGFTAGGLVGLGFADMSRCHSFGGKVIGIGQRSSIGGLIGQSPYGIIRASSAENVILAGQNQSHPSSCGGLAGYLRQGRISDSFATGNVTCGYSVGGLVGSVSGVKISSSYAATTLRTRGGRYVKYVGGLVGYLGDSSSVRRKNVVIDCFAVFFRRGWEEPLCVGNGDASKIDNYCFSIGQRDDHLSSIPGEFTVVKSRNHFLVEDNQPMASWNKAIWTVESGKYPSLNKYFVDSGGPYREERGKPVHLNRATASEGRYRWTVKNNNNTMCSFVDDKVLKPVLTCSGNAKGMVVRVCLTTRNDKQTLRHCSRVESCENSKYLKGRIKKIKRDLDSIKMQMEVIDATGRLGNTTNGLYYFRHYFALVEKAEDELGNAPELTMVGISGAKLALSRLSEKLETAVTFYAALPITDQQGIEDKIRSFMFEVSQYEAESCKIPFGV